MKKPVVDGPYRVVRVPVWGHPDKFGVDGRPARGGRVRVKPFKAREPADKLRDRLNRDYQRYECALWQR